ncbi:MAG: SUMF1/EgtB/PvdO family nonheme iron enzyme [Myxococcales bacterium]|nr:SUMF1/EgtB/PvdO family nonheme iron enzyme [Myxococcales bacterium]
MTHPSTRAAVALALLLWAPGCDDADEGAAAVDAAPLADLRPLPPVGADAGPRCVPAREICNGADDDCDGLVDDDDPDIERATFDDPAHCGACGHGCEAPRAVFECRAATCVIVACEAGFGDYNADASDGCETDCVVTAGGREACDGRDNDCDGSTDEDFDLSTDARHCGACDRACAPPPSGEAACVAGDCVLAACARGFVDLDGEAANGCEYACLARDREDCNGRDDDCDGQIDEAADLAAPEDVCGDTGVCDVECAADADCADDARCNGGVCAPVEPPDLPCVEDADCRAVHPGLACVARSTRGAAGDVTTTRVCAPRTHAPICDGAAGWRCARPPTWQLGAEVGACDGLDNDCDGRTDEDFVEALFEADRATPRTCEVGAGVCRRIGVAICAPAGDTTVCSAAAPEPPAAPDDQCDGVDDDCDGAVDEDAADAWIELDGVAIYAYEASRPGATADAAGVDPRPDDGVVTRVEARACSRPGVLPWADVTWAEADAACAAAGARLCTGAEWAAACGGPDAEAFPYGAAYAAGVCNDGARDADPTTPADDDAALPTGALAGCARDGAFDLSGNLKEWVADGADGLRAVRGGGFESRVAGGLACGQVDDLKVPDFRHPAVGFRCCR